MSFTVTKGGTVRAAFVSVPAGTLVETLKEDEPTSPEPPGLSLAVQGTRTSAACQATAGGVQVTVGGVRSTLMVKVGEALLTVPPLLVMRVSMILELSVAA